MILLSKSKYDPTINVYFALLYNWHALTDVRNFSSSDNWVIPTEVMTNDLISAVGSNGYDLKTIGTTYWVDSGGTNLYNFNGKGSGGRASNSTGSFSQFRYNNYIWTTRTFSMYRIMLNLQSPSNTINYGSITYTNTNGGSARLVNTSSSLVNQGSTGLYTGNDGKVYTSVKIGNYEWLSECLSETRFRNGDIIPWHGANPANYFTQTEWAALTTAGVCAYNDIEANVAEGFTFPI